MLVVKRDGISQPIWKYECTYCNSEIWYDNHIPEEMLCPCCGHPMIENPKEFLVR